MLVSKPQNWCTFDYC